MPPLSEYSAIPSILYLSWDDPRMANISCPQCRSIQGFLVYCIRKPRGQFLRFRTVELCFCSTYSMELHCRAHLRSEASTANSVYRYGVHGMSVFLSTMESVQTTLVNGHTRDPSQQHTVGTKSVPKLSWPREALHDWISMLNTVKWSRLPFNQKGTDVYCFVDTVIAISPNRRTIVIVTHTSTMHLASGKDHTFHACLTNHPQLLSRETTCTGKAKEKVSFSMWKGVAG